MEVYNQDDSTHYLVVMVQLALRSLLFKEVGCPRVASPTAPVPIPVCRKFISSFAAAEISNSITALARGEASGGKDGGAHARAERTSIAEIKPTKIVTRVTSCRGRIEWKEFLADKTICQAGVDLDISVSQSQSVSLVLSAP